MQALADLKAAQMHLSGITDKTFYTRAQLELAILAGDYQIESDAQAAIAELTNVINGYGNTSNNYHKTHLYLSRAQAYLKLGDDTSAEDDLQSAIETFEQQRNSLTTEKYQIIFSAKSALAYQEMIRFQAITRTRPDLAFNYAERSRARVLLDRIERNSTLHSSIKPMTLQEIQSALPADTVLIEYTMLNDRLLIWGVKQHDFTLVEGHIAAEALSQLASEYVSGIERNLAISEVLRISKSLHESLIKPLAEFLPPQATLVIVPHDNLYRIPFASLLDSTSGRYLIEQYPINMSPSATIYIRCLQQDRQLLQQTPPSALIVGNPDFDHRRFPQLPYLKFAEKEATEIAHFYANAQTLIGKQATKAAFLAGSKNHTIIHFAGHAVMDSNIPLNSALLFTARQNGDTDDTLYAYELYQQRFPQTRLVVLAACQTARGQYAPGEGPISLARPFLAANVPAVIASLWNVNDAATTALFTVFHQRVAAGETATLALRQAQLALINSRDVNLHSPMMWAPFILLGGVATHP